MRINTVMIIVVGALAAGARAAAQQPSSDDVNAANSPLTPKITINFHDQAAPQLYELEQGSNAFLFRGVVPHKLGGIPQLFRYTLPVVTAPDGQGGSASEDLTGTGKWQTDLAVLAIAPRSFGIAGALVTWRHSIAGDDARPTQNGLSVQPLVIYNLPQGWYLRSTATWNFAFAQDVWVIPIGAGVGKVWLRPGGSTINAFVEPQFTIAHDGAGQPKFQAFSELNLQFPLRGK